ncbi:glycosyltransferase family 2 protein [Arthrobacter sulfonylureivorans]|uniref:glycosyltransferase family 2 protein n=1 Tax=Arthrobacter sulfonylureivorans TaxID=2486855 RepID=UPI0039E6FB43
MPGAGRVRQPEGPSLSVVIPVLDDAAALAECLALLARQTRPADEVIVVDNGCSDSSVQVALDAGARVVREPGRGIPAAAATGYDAAAGEVIVRCDADTRPPEDWLARIGAAFGADPGLDALTGPGRFYDLPRPLAWLASAAYSSGYRYGAGAALAGVPVWGSNFAMRRTAWQRCAAEIHRHQAGIHDDLDLSFQLAPWATVRFDRGLRVGAAGRMFNGPGAFARRFGWAFATLKLNWAIQSPGQRWLDRVNARRPAFRRT